MTGRLTLSALVVALSAAILASLMAVGAATAGTGNLPIPMSTQSKILRTERPVWNVCVVSTANKELSNPSEALRKLSEHPHRGAREIVCSGGSKRWGRDLLVFLNVTRPSQNRLLGVIYVTDGPKTEIRLRGSFDLETRRIIGHVRTTTCLGFTQRQCEDIRKQFDRNVQKPGTTL